MVNIEKLKEQMRIKGYTPRSLSNKIGIDTSTLYRRYVNKGSDFTIEEVEAIASVLDLSNEEFNNIFFAPEVA
jgi:predicted transcriptional regulator